MQHSTYKNNPIAAPADPANVDVLRSIVKFMEESAGPKSQLQIRKVLSTYDKQTINSTLYKNTTIFVQTPGTPPMWALSTPWCGKSVEVERGDELQKTYVFIDLGNVHNLTDPLKYYPYIEVMGFSDIHYNGNQPKNTTRATISMPNAADVLLIKAFTEIYIKTRGKASYIICSKDSIFAPFPHMYENTQIITKWDLLKLEL